MMAGRLSLRAVYALLVSVSLLSTLCVADAVSDLATKGRPAVDAVVAKSTTCTKDKLQVRREWYVPLLPLSSA
jgi:tyrosinase